MGQTKERLGEWYHNGYWNEEDVERYKDEVVDRIKVRLDEVWEQSKQEQYEYSENNRDSSTTVKI